MQGPYNTLKPTCVLSFQRIFPLPTGINNYYAPVVQLWPWLRLYNLFSTLINKYALALLVTIHRIQRCSTYCRRTGESLKGQ